MDMTFPVLNVGHLKFLIIKLENLRTNYFRQYKTTVWFSLWWSHFNISLAPIFLKVMKKFPVIAEFIYTTKLSSEFKEFFPITHDLLKPRGFPVPIPWPSRHSLPFCQVVVLWMWDQKIHMVTVCCYHSISAIRMLWASCIQVPHLVFVWKGWKRAVGKCWEFISSCGIMATGLTSSILLSLSTTEPKSLIYRSRFTPVVIKQYTPCFTGKKQNIQTQNKRECRWGVGEWNLPEMTRLE